MKILNVTIALMTLVLLGACSSKPGSPPQRHNPEHSSSIQGLVFVHFPRTMPEQFWIRSVKSPQDFYLLENNQHKSTAQLWLPPGEYQLYSVMYGEGGTMLEGYPSFNIEADKITSLGGISDFNVGGGNIMWLPKSTKLTNTLVKDIQSKLGQLLTKIQVNQWQMEQLPKVQEWIVKKSGSEIIPYLKKRHNDKTINTAVRHDLKDLGSIEAFYGKATSSLPPLPYQIPAMDNDNNLYFGGEFGFIKKRSEDGQWQNIKTNLEQAISKVVWFDNKLIAAGKHGRLILSEDKGQSWKTIKTFGLNEKVYDLAIDRQNFMVVTTRPEEDKTEVMLYHGAYASSPQLTDETVFSFSEDHNAYPVGTMTGNRYYIGLKPKELGSSEGLFGPSTSYYFDNSTLKLHGLVVPKPYSYFNINDDGHITVYASKGILTNMAYSSDGGKNWQDKTAPSVYASNVILNTPSTGTALSYRKLKNGLKSYKLQSLDSATGQWKHLNDVPTDCKYLLKDHSQSIKFCVTGADKVLSLDDKGWKYERFH